ncbi:MAG: amidase family protein, partial [Roseiflexaceae bacterium]
TSADCPVTPYRSAATADLSGLVIGRPREYFPKSLDARVAERCDAALGLLRARGAQIRDVSLPHTDLAIPVYYIIAPAEASSNLARYDGVRYGLHVDDETYWDELEKTRGLGFGPEVRRRIMLGTYALSAGYYDAYYKRAQQVRTLIRRDFQQAFEQVDLLAAPTAPTVAFPIGAKTDDPLAMYLEDVFTLPISLAGLPGLVVPCGFSAGMPVGLQLVGRPFDEATLLRVGDAYQRITDWHTRLPAIVAE